MTMTLMTRMLRTIGAGGLLLAAASGCTKTPAYLYGIDLTNLKLTGFESPKTEGVWPDTSVLKDANNPFKDDPPTSSQPDGGPIPGKWQIQGGAGPVAAFYSWASVLATEPNGDGEAQYYVADSLRLAESTGAYDTTNTALHDQIVALSVAGYYGVLANFPDAVTYLADGKHSIPLAPQAVSYIVALTGVPPTGWYQVEGPDGKTPIWVHQ